MKKGILIVFSGPSGVGKGTVLKHLENYSELNLAYSVSMTTRKKRDGEVEGVNYFFVSKEEFENSIKNNELLEYAEFIGNYYGTPVSNVNKMLEEGKNVFLEIEVQGAMQVMGKCPEALSIFIVPPSMDELERRIRNRNTETEEVIMKRLKKAEKEMELVGKYKYVICNDEPLKAATTIKSIIERNL